MVTWLYLLLLLIGSASTGLVGTLIANWFTGPYGRADGKSLPRYCYEVIFNK